MHDAAEAWRSRIFGPQTCMNCRHFVQRDPMPWCKRFNWRPTDSVYDMVTTNICTEHAYGTPHKGQTPAEPDS